MGRAVVREVAEGSSRTPYSMIKKMIQPQGVSPTYIQPALSLEVGNSEILALLMYPPS